MHLPINKKTYIILIPLLIVSGLSILFFSYRKSVHYVPALHKSYIFGLDVSHYQGYIHWNKVVKSKHPIEFVFCRATMGKNGIDRQFKQNWKKIKQHGFIRGAYHYYRPGENSTQQFNHFKKYVHLEEGDFPPVLDVEEVSPFGQNNLREGIKNWLELAEEHYGIKPIIYTGRKYYTQHLQGYFDEYPLWIASYSGKHKIKHIPWRFHQFSDKVRVKGIRGYVDGNDFRGKKKDLVKMTYSALNL